jgi:hypothetical protein
MTDYWAPMRRCAGEGIYERRVHPFAVSPLTRDRWPKPSRIILRYLDQVIAHAPLTPSEAVSGQRCDTRRCARAHGIAPGASARRGRSLGSRRAYSGVYWAPVRSRSFLERRDQIHQSAIMPNRKRLQNAQEGWYDRACSPRLADATRVSPKEVNIDMKDTNRQHALRRTGRAAVVPGSAISEVFDTALLS